MSDTNGHPQGSERFQVLSRIINSIKEDKPVTLSPCGLKMVRCTNGGIEEIKGFEELELRDKMYVTKTVLQIHEDIFNKHREMTMKNHAQAQQQGGMSKIIEATGHDKSVLSAS